MHVFGDYFVLGFDRYKDCMHCHDTASWREFERIGGDVPEDLTHLKKKLTKNMERIKVLSGRVYRVYKERFGTRRDSKMVSVVVEQVGIWCEVINRVC